MLVAIARDELADAAGLLAAIQALAKLTGSNLLLDQQAALAEARGDLAEARRLLEEFVHGVEVEQGVESPIRLIGLARLAWVALQQIDTRAAVAACAQSLALQYRLGPARFFLMRALSVLALAAERGGLCALSARLSAVGVVQWGAFTADVAGLQAGQRAAVARVRAALGEAAFAEAWAAGETLSADEAIELGLAAVAEVQQIAVTDAAAVDQGR